MWRVWGQLGLRARIMGLYAAGGLLLSLIIAVATLTLARQNLLEDREDRAFPVAIRNAARVEGALSGETEHTAAAARYVEIDRPRQSILPGHQAALGA